MAVTTSGLWGQTLKDSLLNDAAISLDTNIKCALFDNSSTPSFDDTTPTFASMTTEVVGTNYTAGGNALGTPTLTVASPAATQLKFDADDAQWTSSTIPSSGSAPICAVVYNHTTVDYTIYLAYFGSTASTSAGTFTVAWHSNGLFYLDYA